MKTTENFFEGSGAQAVKFPTIGTKVTGTVVGDMEVRQRTDISTGELLTWPDGNPKLQMVLALATDERDPNNADDDGERRLFIPDPGGLKTAIGLALSTAKAKSLKPGGKLTIVFSSETPSQTRGFNPSKNYTATYEPPAADAGFFNGGPAVPEPAVGSVATPNGVDPQVWATLSPEVQAALKAQAQPA